MPVYVDNARLPYRNMAMSHLVADSVDELHGMADAIGLERGWFQPKSYPHYDVSESKRALAIRSGALPITSRRAVTVAKTCRVEAEE